MFFNPKQGFVGKKLFCVDPHDSVHSELCTNSYITKDALEGFFEGVIHGSYFLQLFWKNVFFFTSYISNITTYQVQVET